MSTYTDPSTPEVIKKEIELEHLKYNDAMNRDAPLSEKKEIRTRIRKLKEVLDSIYKNSNE